jgi:hypothetical protein
LPPIYHPSNELDVTGLALLGELGVLRKKPVARVNRVHIRDLSRADDSISPQVAVGAFRTTDTDSLVRQLHVQRLHVGLRINREGLYPQLSASPNNAKGNLASVGD